MAYAVMFVTGGTLGLLGTRLLSKTPEPQAFLPKESLTRLYRRPFVDKNFRYLLQFQALWAFSLNVATPFLTVFLLKSLGLKLSTVIIAGMCAQIACILAVRKWGAYSDRFSNKSILRIAAPLYIFVILLWPIPALYSSHTLRVCFVIFLNIFSGMTSAGVNLSLNNIAIKLAPKDEAVVFLSARSMTVALASAFGPLLGGTLADYFSVRKIAFAIDLNGLLGFQTIRLINLHSYGFLFIIGGLLAFAALHFLKFVNEDGESCTSTVTSAFRTNFKNSLRHGLSPSFLFATVRDSYQRRSQHNRKMRNRLSKRLGLR